MPLIKRTWYSRVPTGHRVKHLAHGPVLEAPMPEALSTSSTHSAAPA